MYLELLAQMTSSPFAIGRKKLVGRKSQRREREETIQGDKLKMPSPAFIFTLTMRELKACGQKI